MRKFQGTVANHHGFMLIELIIVLVLMTFLSVFVLTRTPTGHATLAGESESIRSRLRYVQNLALADDKNSWSLKFTADPGYQLVHNDLGPMLLPGADSLTVPLPSGYTVTVKKDGTAAPDGKIAFDLWGAPAGGVDYAVVLSDTENMISETIQILKHTGFIQ